jgi:Trk-type K+ transport system membrane component
LNWRRSLRWCASRPELWLTAALLLFTWAGSHLLLLQSCIELPQRDREYFEQRLLWQARFDALSATCGVGLLINDLRDDYTPLGRWVLVTLGVGGALVYISAARLALGRLLEAGGARLPRLILILAGYLAIQVLVLPVVAVVERVAGSWGGLGSSIWQGISVFSSLGWLHTWPGAGHNWVFALVALLGALGWPFWIMPWKRALPVRRLLLAACSYVLMLLIAATLICALEVPRGMPRGRAPERSAERRLADAAPRARFVRSLIEATCVSGAGITVERLDDRRVGEGTKCVLAGLILIGGLGGSAGGGMHWTLVLWALVAGAALFGVGPGRSRSEAARRCWLAGSATVLALAGLALVIALGLLIIEAWIGSPFQTPPTFADALLDASSAVGGANLTSGLTATLTSPNLSSGIRQSVDLYQYGMKWLMLAMLIGRILPIVILERVADLRMDRDTSPTLPPLA